MQWSAKIAVRISSRLSQGITRYHINEKINTANRSLELSEETSCTLVLTTYIGIDNFSQLYKALVHPHLEFENQIWAPHLKSHTEALENVQHQVTKMLPELRELSYPRLKIPTLTSCRLRRDMIELYKILSGKFDPDVSNNFLQLLDHNANTRGHHLKIKKTRPRTNLWNNSFKLHATAWHLEQPAWPSGICT